MFGYVTANKPELKIREFARYKGYYCGLCHTLLENHGRRGQMTLTYDMTFLVILLSSLYEPKEEETVEKIDGAVQENTSTQEPQTQEPTDTAQ